MKQFETMTELEILRAANITILSSWENENNILEKNPDNKIAKNRIQRFEQMLEELNTEICRLERESKQN